MQFQEYFQKQIQIWQLTPKKVAEKTPQQDNLEGSIAPFHKHAIEYLKI